MARPFGTKNIETPEKMWEYFEKYCQQLKGNPIKVQDYVGKDGMKVDRERERPLTLEGFENYCWEYGIISDLSDYFENKDKRYSDYVPICRAIKKTIRNDQIEGGMVGIYNPSITQRLNNLVEKTDTNTTGDITITVKYDKGDNTTPE